MMRLFLVRHGLAEDEGPDGSDEARRLTAVGQKRIRAAALGLGVLGVNPDAILTSPVTRARETADILGEVLGQAPQALAALQTGSSPHGVVRALAAFEAQRRLLVVGHEPWLSEVVALLLTGTPRGLDLRFKQGTCVALDVSTLAANRVALLRWMATARQLAGQRRA
jgi:phosphohistidine phosphatase